VSAQYTAHPSCQIPDLGRILGARFDHKTDGTFVEVGAFDGEMCSNTSFLADLGWRGVYVEPVPAYAQACEDRHRRNSRVSVLQCAVGAVEQTVTLSIGHVLTTADPQMAQAYGQIEWAKPFHRGETVAVQQLRLDSILALEDIPREFDLLVVDVEGSEESVFASFDLVTWRPRMIIAEIEDGHPSFQAFPAIIERAQRVRQLVLGQRYTEIYRDSINTIFWDTTLPASAR
jgi:FkbM family methyltransferase